MNQQQIEVHIEGMKCAGCSTKIQRKMLAADGIEESYVNFATSRGYFVGSSSLDSVIDKLRAIGYSATKPNHESPDLLPSISLATLVVAAFLALASMIFMQQKAPILWMLLVALLASFFPGRSFLANGYRELLTSRPLGMDSLITLGITATLLYSIAAWSLNQPVYFDAVSMIVFFITLGRYLEENIKNSAFAAVRNQETRKNKKALVFQADSGSYRSVPRTLLKQGDKIKVAQGEALPVDCKLLDRAEFDLSVTTGESAPRLLSGGDIVEAGAINLSPFPCVAIAHQPSHLSYTDRVNEKVSQALAQRPKAQILADKISGYFVPGILVIAAVVFIFWYVSLGSTLEALLPAIAVLMVACPCALGLAIPSAIVAGFGRSAQFGIVFHSADGLDKARTISSLITDKTGTLTEGRPEVKSWQGKPLSSELEQQIFSATQSSSHPLSQAIHKYLDLKHSNKSNSSQIDSSTKTKELIGQGIEVILDNPHRTLRIGKKSFAGEANPNLAPTQWQETLEKSSSPDIEVHIGIDKNILGKFLVQDPIRRGAREAIDQLKKDGTDVIMATGDTEISALSVAGELNITRVHSETNPEEKAQLVRELRKQNQSVAFLGDGVNDALALGEADLSLAIAGGSDIAQAAAHATVFRTGLVSVVRGLSIAKKTAMVIRQNLFWAFIYNMFLIPLAASGLLSPKYAALAMAASSVCVVLNSLRLKFA